MEPCRVPRATLDWTTPNAGLASGAGHFGSTSAFWQIVSWTVRRQWFPTHCATNAQWMGHGGFGVLSANGLKNLAERGAGPDGDEAEDEAAAGVESGQHEGARTQRTEEHTS